jgi:hypothetical protein
MINDCFTLHGFFHVYIQMDYIGLENLIYKLVGFLKVPSLT